MRLRRHAFKVRTGDVLVCDPRILSDIDRPDHDDRVVFDSWSGDGDFMVYSDGDCYFVNIDPRIFKAGSRSQLAALPGRVSCDSAEVQICDLTPERRAAAQGMIDAGQAVVVHGLPPATYQAWFEEKGAAKDLFRGVIGFGPEVKMVLNRSTGMQLQELEDRISRVYRQKGESKRSEFEAIGRDLIELHLSGCNDPRLKMLADAARVKLPRRTAKRRAAGADGPAP